jgi:PAS domain-containing protein
VPAGRRAVSRITNLLKSLRLPKEAGERSAVPRLSIEALFDATLEATLIVDAGQGTVLEANPAAADLLRRARATLVGSPWLGAFSGDSTLALTKLETLAHTAGVAGPVRARLRDADFDVDVALSLVRAAPAEFLLAHLSPAPGFPVAPPIADPLQSTDALAAVADGFVVTDAGLRALYANPAFAVLAGQRAPKDVVGKSLTRWIEFSQEQLSSLAAQMETREAVSVVRALLVPAGSKAAGRPIELTVVAVPDDPQRCFGFWIREASPAATPPGTTP